MKTMRKPKATARSHEKGQSLVEFAIGLVILMILLTGIADTGRALFTFMAMRDAAQEAAIYGSTHPAATSEIQARARGSSNTMQAIASDPSASYAVNVTVSGAACTGSAITIQIVYNNFPITVPLLGTIIGSQTVPIRASVTDTILSPSC